MARIERRNRKVPNNISGIIHTLNRRLRRCERRPQPSKERWSRNLPHISSFVRGHLVSETDDFEKGDRVKRDVGGGDRGIEDGKESHIPSPVPRANITITGLHASVDKPFSVVTAAMAALSVKKCAVLERCSVVATWISAGISAGAAASGSGSARGWVRTRVERERRMGSVNFIFWVGDWGSWLVGESRELR